MPGGEGGVGADDLPVSWVRLHRESQALAAALTETGEVFSGIVAVTRGGLVPAAILAKELEIRLVETACIASYDDRTQGEATILKPPEAALESAGSGWIVADDLADTGETLKHLRALLPRACFATVYVKPAGRPLVDVFVTEVPQDRWILFPWDLPPEPEQAAGPPGAAPG
jgi:xanthine phosphoribosyltransferase